MHICTHIQARKMCICLSYTSIHIYMNVYIYGCSPTYIHVYMYICIHTYKRGSPLGGADGWV